MPREWRHDESGVTLWHAGESVSRPDTGFDVRRSKLPLCLTQGTVREIPRSAGLIGVFLQTVRSAYGGGEK